MTTETGSFGSYSARLVDEDVGGCVVRHWQVADLERHVDRHALLSGDDPRDPPYWAHLWSGARILARALPPQPGRTVELGCGLGLPGLAAAARGGAVTFVDWLLDPLRFVRASLAVNHLAGTLCVADFRAIPLRTRFDLVLAAEILYDRTAFGPLIRALASLVAPAGRVLLTDGQRIDTRVFYPAFAAAGFHWRETLHVVQEEGIPVSVRLIEATRDPGTFT